jgi:hypothetical protein
MNRTVLEIHVPIINQIITRITIASSLLASTMAWKNGFLAIAVYFDFKQGGKVNKDKALA